MTEQEPETPSPEPSETPAQKAQSAYSAWIRYSAMGFQFLGYILLLTLAGWYLDRLLANATPWGLIGGALLGSALGMGFLVRQFLKK